MALKRMIGWALALLMVCAPGVPGFSEEEVAAVLPSGDWQAESAVWKYCLAADLHLVPQQVETLVASGEEAPAEGVFPAGTLLSQETLFLLYPGAEDYFGVPEALVDIEQFSLTGSWAYDAGGELVYVPGGDVPTMTKDMVFRALGGERQRATDNEKTIYLTIDDSPTQYTMELLAELDRLDVAATFFVVGAYVKKYPVFLRAISEEGHVIGNHSYSHDAGVLSKGEKSSLRDFQRCEEEVAAALESPLSMPLIRVPYGSSTLSSASRAQLQSLGYMWIDWNTLNGDTESGIKSDEDALKRAFSTSARYDGDLVMLVHDGKKRTIRTLEAMVTHYRAQGYEFRALHTGIDEIPGVRIGFPQGD